MMGDDSAAGNSSPEPAEPAEPVEPARSVQPFESVESVEPLRSDSGLKPALFGGGAVVLLVAAIATLVSLVGSVGDDADKLTIDDVASTVGPPPVTFDASIGDRPDIGRDISITDEPIVIDADGNIVDPQGGNGTDTLPSQAGGSTDDGGAVLVVPDDAFTGDNATGPSATSPSNGDAETDAETDDGLNILGGDDPEDKRMPDLICRGLQAAQDEIQDHGVFGSKSKDATGKGRRQIWDRNWIVVAQDPEPGEKIGEFEAVLYVVKKGDDENVCD